MRPANPLALVLADATVASVTSVPIDTTSWVACSCVGVAVGATITGALKFQVSNDPPISNPLAIVNWVDCTQTVSITGAGSFLIPKFDVSYNWMRIVYTKSTSVAGAKISAYIKSIGF